MLTISPNRYDFPVIMVCELAFGFLHDFSRKKFMINLIINEEYGILRINR